MQRIEEALDPLPPSLESAAAQARDRFHKMSPESQTEIFQQVLNPAIMERPAWAIPGCPFVHVESAPIPEVVQQVVTQTIDELLDHGSLPPHMSLNAMNALGTSVPRYKAHETRAIVSAMGAITLGLSVGAAMGMSAFTTSAMATIVGGAGAFFLRDLMRRPDYHGEFAAGCLLECMHADQVLRGRSDTIPTLTESVHSYFNDPNIPRVYNNPVQSEGFLAARTLRIFGYSPVEIFEGFRAPNSLSPEDSLIINLLLESLYPQEISLDQPLTETLRNPTKGTNEKTVSLLETLNRAHFTWALRDKQKLRHEVAIRILEIPENQDLSATE